MLSITDIEEILSVNLIGIIPESQSVLSASNTGNPVTCGNMSDAQAAYRDAVARILGTPVPLRLHKERKTTVLERLMGHKDKIIEEVQS